MRHQLTRRRGPLVLALSALLAGTSCSDGGRPVADEHVSSGVAYSKIGDCMNSRQPPALAVPLDCAAPDATYVIAERLEGQDTKGCPTPSYDSYTQEGSDGDFTLCLTMNGDQGDCFSGYARLNQLKAKTPCAEADATVTRTFEGRADRSACPAGTDWRLAYPVPAPGRTVCIAAHPKPADHQP